MAKPVKKMVKKAPGKQIMKQGFDRMKGGDNHPKKDIDPAPGISSPARPVFKYPQKPFPIKK